MISPTPSGSPTPVRPSRAQTLARLSPVDSRIASSEPPLQIIQPGMVEVYEARPVHAGSWLRHGLLIGMGLATMTAGSPAMAAQQFQVHVQPKKNVDPAVQLLLNSKLAHGQTGPVDLPTEYGKMNQIAVARLRTLPPEVQSQYVQLEPPARRYLSGQIHGKSSILGVKVENRQAFVKGSVWGVNVFGIVRSDLHSRVKSGEIPAQLEVPVNKLVTSLSQLTRAQRETLVQVLEAEYPPAAKKV